jgi:hypothetical protein
MKHIKLFESFINESEESDVNDIKEYFEDYGIKWSGKFDLKQFIEETGIKADNAEMFLVNLEDSDVMQEIADGDYSNFDPQDSSIFNDCYEDMMDDMGLDTDE